MASMIPATIPEATKSGAEKRLFDILREKLDESFIVFHSFNLLTQNKQSKFIDGEIDFLIFSPELGFLILEVKGGNISYDGSQGIWYQNEKPMKMSPFSQAENSKYKLTGFLRKKLGHAPGCTFAHAVCFPDIFAELKGLPSGGDARICITGQKLLRIHEVIIEIVGSYRGERDTSLTEEEAEQIQQILMPYCEYGTSLVDRIGQEEQVIFRLTEDQCRLLEFISGHKQALIEGGAGSGKTVMAVKKARELALQGNKVLLLAYNKLIGENLAAAVSDLTNVTASTYHKFCMDRLREAGMLPEQVDTPDYWVRQIPEAFARFISQHPIKYDAVIVDEGQDFRVEYWVTVTEMVKEGGYFYIFYDPGQNLYDIEPQLPINKEPFILPDNCRNTRKIHDRLKQYSSKLLRLHIDAPEGEPIEEITIPNKSVRRRKLGKILHDLVNNQGIDRNRIVILGGHSMEHTCIGDNPVIGSFRITETMEDGPNTINYHTYMKFKGCEADVVILIDVDKKDERWANPISLYTAVSRAKHLLYILYC